MARLEDLTRGAHVTGIRPEGPVEVLDARWHGANALELTYRAPDGKPGNELLFRDREASLEIGTRGPAYGQRELPDAEVQERRLRGGVMIGGPALPPA